MRRIGLIFLGFAFSLGLGASLSATERPVYVFSATGVAGTTPNSAFVTIGEPLPVAALKKRYPGYEIQSVAGEDCEVCAFVTSGSDTLEVHYDPKGITVVQLISYARNATDSLGNSVGDRLQAAVGTSARCEEGDNTTCSARNIDHLAYIVELPNGCTMPVAGNTTETSIPACALIGGFVVSAPPAKAPPARQVNYIPRLLHGYWSSSEVGCNMFTSGEIDKLSSSLARQFFVLKISGNALEWTHIAASCEIVDAIPLAATKVSLTGKCEYKGQEETTIYTLTIYNRRMKMQARTGFWSFPRGGMDLFYCGNK